MLESLLRILTFLAAFGLIALASNDIGRLFARFRLPLISGFLICGMVAGPHVLDLISAAAVAHLAFIDEIAIAFIAFAAGAELHLTEFRDRLRSIAWVTGGSVLAAWLAGFGALLLLAPWLPSIAQLDVDGRVGVALLAAAILVARSPSSAIAIIKELRARGPFTRTVLGVTVMSDILVIVLFALASAAAGVLLSGSGFHASTILLLLVDLSLSVVVGVSVGLLLRLILSLHASEPFKAALILASGWLVYVVSGEIRHVSPELVGAEILLEPLLICMIAGLYVANYTRYRAEFLAVIHDAGPMVFIAFFTLTGASLELDVLAGTWPVALALVGARLVGIAGGAVAGGIAAGDPAQFNRVSWAAYITQAGVGLGLAKEVAVAFPGWGDSFATTMIGAIVVNQLIGPPLFKWAIRSAGESHSRADTPGFDGIRDAIIFGNEGQALALAQQLAGHGWKVRLATVGESPLEEPDIEGVELHRFDRPSREMFDQLDAPAAEGIVAMLDDDLNYRICEIAYEHYGTDTLVTRINDPARLSDFRELGVLVVDPRTAIVSLLDHFVRSPDATSMLLGLTENRDVIELQISNPNYFGVELRELSLPEDTLILSVRRGENTLITHGYTRLQQHDWVTVLGSPASLESLMFRLER